MERLPLAYAESLPPPPVVIPDELIREILLSLPVKFLVRFECVCKYWKLIISDPQFVKLHLRRSSSNVANLAHTRLLYDLFNSHDHLPPYALPRCVPLLFSSQNQHGYHLYPVENEYGLIGVCNGLVCQTKWDYVEPLHVYLSVQVRFWNPATRLWSQLSPTLNLGNRYRSFFCSSFGFGYDCVNDTYKVVAVAVSRFRDHEEERLVKVYDMGGSFWRNIQSFPVVSLSRMSKVGVYISGTLNWEVMTDHGFNSIIVSLNLGEEKYSQFLFPEEDKFPFLGVLNDCLCVLLYDGFKRFTIWQMKVFGAYESWTQLFKFDLEEDLFIRGIPGVVLSKNDEVLFISSVKRVLYNLKDNTFEISRKYIGTLNYNDMVDSWNVENYIESLVSPR